MKVYPNPAQNILNIEFNENFESVEIVSLDGKTLLSEDINNFTGKVDISLLEKGAYICRVKTDSGELLLNRFLKY